jgi:hypothetical protein
MMVRETAVRHRQIRGKPTDPGFCNIGNTAGFWKALDCENFAQHADGNRDVSHRRPRSPI